MSSREQFEAWMTAEQWFHDSDFDWDERRNCYSQFGIHLAYKSWQAATSAMEAKCAALAAENAGLKNFIVSDCHVAHIEPETFYEEEVTRYVSADGYEPETPATDAFLAEARAQGVEMFAASERKLAEKHASTIDTSSVDYGAARADDFAVQLRQDANTAELVAAGIITKVGE